MPLTLEAIMALSIAKTDLVASEVRWEEFETGVRIKLAGLDFKPYQVALERARRLIHASDAAQSLSNISASASDETEYSVQCQLIGKFIVQDWDGVTDANGDKIPYSAADAEWLLKNNIEFFTWVLKKATEVSIKAAQEAAEARKKQ